MDEAVVPIKRKRRKSASLDAKTNEAVVRPTGKRRASATNPNREIVKTMRRLQIATTGLGPSAPEIFKAATLQCVQVELEKIREMLSWIVPQSAPTQQPYPPFMPPSAVGQAIVPGIQLTPEQTDALYAKKAPKQPGLTCQIDGQPATYVTKKGTPYCAVHAKQGMEDDQADVINARLRAQGFGGNEEVIRVPMDVIQNAIARGDSEDG